MLLENTRMRAMMLKARMTFSPMNTSKTGCGQYQISTQPQEVGLTSSWGKHGGSGSV